MEFMEYRGEVFKAISDAQTALDRAQKILMNGKQEAEEACISASSTFLFRSLESNIFGVVRARTAEEAERILCAELGESVELLRADEDLVFWAAKTIGRQ
jgi:hypothetical protein